MIGKRILFIGAHIDDIAYGCGGTILKMKEHNDVFCLTLTNHSFNPDNNPTYEKEYTRCMEMIGPKDYVHHNFDTRYFDRQRQEILDSLHQARELFSPDVVFFHGEGDKNPDHYTVSQEGFRAFRRFSSLITYTYPHNTLGMDYNCLVELNEEQAYGKVNLIKVFKSQKEYNYLKNIIAQLKVMGIAYNLSYAELFKIIKFKL